MCMDMHTHTCTHRYVHIDTHMWKWKKEDKNDLSYLNFQTNKNALIVICDHCESMSLLELLGSSWTLATLTSVVWPQSPIGQLNSESIVKRKKKGKFIDYDHFWRRSKEAQ